MRVYRVSLKRRRVVERKTHLGVGHGVRTACGVTLWSRLDDLVITDQPALVTCKRCLAARARWQRMLELEVAYPGIFDRDSLCGTDWLLSHARDVSQETIDAQSLVVSTGARLISVRNDMRLAARKELLRSFVAERRTNG